MTAVHRIAARTFDEIAAGYGDAAAIRELAAAQVSRRLLLLRAVVDTARERAPAAYKVARVGDALAVLRAVQARSPDAITGMLLHPPVGVWLAHCLHRLYDVDTGQRLVGTDLGYLCGVAAAAATRAGAEFEIAVPVLDGTIMLPSLGRVVAVPDTGPVPVHGRAGRLLVEAGRNPIDVTDPLADGDGWQSLRRIEPVAGAARLTVLVDDIDPYRDCYERPVLPRLSGADFAELRGRLSAAWELLAAGHPAHAAALAARPISLVPLLRPAPGKEVSAASRRAFGSIGSSIPAHPATFAEILVHEFNHVKLGALLDVVSLCSGPSPARYRVAWRGDERPVGAVLQGVYAHLGVADFWRIHRSRVCGEEVAAAEAEFARRLDQVSSGVDTLTRCGELTPAGRRFLQCIANALVSWGADSSV